MMVPAGARRGSEKAFERHLGHADALHPGGVPRCALHTRNRHLHTIAASCPCRAPVPLLVLRRASGGPYFRAVLESLEGIEMIQTHLKSSSPKKAHRRRRQFLWDHTGIKAMMALDIHPMEQVQAGYRYPRGDPPPEPAR